MPADRPAPNRTVPLSTATRRPVLSRRATVAVLLPPVLVAIVGLTHPPHLTMSAAEHWRNMHIVLLPLFPLLALGPWLVGRAIHPAYGWVTLVLGYVYATFYSALDILAGIAAGALKVDMQSGLGTVFRWASDLGAIGSWAFIAATAVAASALLRTSGLWVLPGAVLALVGSVGFLIDHIYVPWGVLSQVAIAAGWALMLLAMRRAPVVAAVPR